jgi:NADPH:quinone reductase-like Zn-dependent oxidoreductase
MEVVMRAVVIEQFGGPEQLVLRERPDPAPRPGHVLIEVKAFGLNHAEIYFRSGAWGDVAKVSGIECVGLVRADPDGRFAAGQKVAALMGGMGRSIDGSYAELTRVPAANVVPIDTDLAWEEFAAIPESYATAWTCLNRNLALAPGQTVLVRGATSALGQAAVNIAVAAGARVIATTRNRERLATLRALGAERAVIDDPALSRQVRSDHPKGIDAVLDIVGNSTLVDSLAMPRPDGRVCMVGFLGGGAPLAAFDPLVHMSSCVHLSFFISAFTFGGPDWPLADIPLQAIVDRAAKGIYKAKPARVFRLEQIQDAHRLMESNGANGKIVVRI